MTKRLVKETVREYDESGNLIRETVTETPNPFWSIEPTCTCSCTDNCASSMMYLE